jgi:antitoxin VapB
LSDRRTRPKGSVLEGCAMALTIKDDETERLARELAALTGESLTEAVTTALRERLEIERRRDSGSIVEKLNALGGNVDPEPAGRRRPQGPIGHP